MHTSYGDLSQVNLRDLLTANLARRAPKIIAGSTLPSTRSFLLRAVICGRLATESVTDPGKLRLEVKTTVAFTRLQLPCQGAA